MKAVGMVGTLEVTVNEYDANNIGIYHDSGALLASVRIVNGALSLVVHPVDGLSAVNTDSGRIQVYSPGGTLSGS
mgnify:CR=1 FL=1